MASTPGIIFFSLIYFTHTLEDFMGLTGQPNTKEHIHAMENNLLQFSDSTMDYDNTHIQISKTVIDMLRNILLHTLQRSKLISTCANNYKKYNYTLYTDDFSKWNQNNIHIKPCSRFYPGGDKSDREFIKENKKFLEGKPCKKSYAKTHTNIWSYQLAGTMCIPKHPLSFQSQSRYGYTIILVGDNRFYFNLSFTQFSFYTHPWCYADFLHIAHPKKSKVIGGSLEYVFCGKRHPWTILYTSSVVMIQTIARKTSNFTLLFQITDTTPIKMFHICQIDQCQPSKYCHMFSDKNSTINGTDKVFLSHSIKFTYKLSITILYILVKRYNYLVITANINTLIHSVYDGPSIESQKIKLFKSQFRMSSFQATIVVNFSNITKLQKSEIFKVTSFINKQNTTELPNYEKIQFFKPYTEKCILFKTTWLRQPKDFSYNISVDYIKYSGPEEQRELFYYGGIFIYLIGENGEDESVLSMMHSMSQNNSDVLRERKKEYSLISRLTTKYVVIVYYYHLLYSTVEAQLSVSTTSCVGYFIQPTFCYSKHQIAPIIDENVNANHLKPNIIFLNLRNLSKCFVVTIYNNLASSYNFRTEYDPETHFLLTSDCSSLYGFKIDIFYMFNKQYTKEIELNNYMYTYQASFLSSSVVLVNNLRKDNTKLGIHTYSFRGGSKPIGRRLEYCKDDPSFQPSLREQSVQFSSSGVIHQKISTVSSMREKPIHLFPNFLHIVSNWATVSINLLSCNRSKVIFHLLPFHFVQYAIALNCKHLEKTSQHKLAVQLKNNGFTVQHISKVFYTKFVFNESNVAIIFGSLLLYDVQSSLITQVYITSNLSNTSHHGSLELQYDPIHSNKIKLDLPSEDLHIVIPTVSVPRCYICRRNYCLNRCEPVFVSLSRSLGHLLDRFSITTSRIRDFSFPKQYHHTVWKSHCKDSYKYCYGQFLTWYEANDLCESKGMHLPAVHSTQDMEDIVEQIERYQCEASTINVQNDTYSVRVMYQTIAIYIGLNSKINKNQWTSGSPVNVQFFQKSFERNNSWMSSWTLYRKFLKLYYENMKIPLYMPANLPFREYIIWQSSADYQLVNEVTKVYNKSLNIDRLLKYDNKNTTCTIMMVWHKHFLNWVKIPCDEPVLDKVTLYCVNSTINKINKTLQHDSNTFKPKSMFPYTIGENMFTTYLCNNGIFISVIRVCNNYDDCAEGEDEAICSMTHNNISLKQVFGCHQITIQKEFNSTYMYPLNNLSSLQHMNSTCYDKRHNILSTNQFQVKNNYTCLNETIRCIYSVNDKHTDRSQMYCTNGTHLDSCEHFQCADHFKCPNYYCVPWRYICNGFWDCPLGYDESNCDSISRPGFYHCSNSSIYILPQSICDWISDCPDNSDEKLCSLHDIICPDVCTCLFYSIFCTNLSSFISTRVYLPHTFILIENEYNIGSIFLLIRWAPHVVFIHLTNNNFPIFSMRSGISKGLVSSVFAPRNNISALSERSFQTVPNTTYLSLKNNRISEIHCDAFFNMKKLKVLSIYKNKLHTIKKCHFRFFHKIVFLDFRENNLKVVDEDIFTGITKSKILILSSHFATCCFSFQIQCTASATWPQSCSNMLHSTSTKIVSLVCSLIGFFLNTVLIITIIFFPDQKQNQYKPYDIVAVGVGISNMLFSLILFILFATDDHYGKKFIFTEFMWKKSITCYMISFLTLLASVFSAFIIILLAILRYVSVFDPFNVRLKYSSFTFRTILIGSLFSFTVSIILTVFTLIMNDDQIPSKLCIPLGNTGHPLPNTVITITLFLLGIISTITVTFCYVSIICKVQKQPIITSTDAPKSNKWLTIKSSVAICANSLTWVPASIVFMMTFTVKEYPYELLIWTVIIIMPVNSWLTPLVLQNNYQVVFKRMVTIFRCN